MDDGFGFDDVDVDAQLRRRTLKWSMHGPDVLAAWVAEMDFAAAPVVRDALADAVEREQFGYPCDDEDTGLPEAVAGWMAHRHGWTIDPASVHSVPDVVRGVRLAVEFFTEPGSAVVVPTPAYAPFFRVPGMAGRTLVDVASINEGGRYRLDLDGIDDAFDAGAGSIILCHPYNPVGTCFAPAELEALAQVVERHGARVVSDEIHAPLVFRGGVHVPYASLSATTAEHTLTLTSATKAWNVPGLKCAVAITSNDADEKTWLTMAPEAHGASTLGMVASIAAFTAGEPWLDAALAYLDDTRTWLSGELAEHLPSIGYQPPEATYLAWLDCRPLELSTAPGRFFLEHAGVALNEGSSFGPAGEGFVRLNLATSRSVLQRIVRQMGEVVVRHCG